ncbi:MAG: nucleoside recognition domain-containing protein [Bacillota bacterium]
MPPMTDILYEGLRGSALNILRIATIVLPFMVVMQVIKELNLLDRLSAALAPLIRSLGMSKGAAFPLLAGLVFGLSYGAGLIIQSARDGSMTRRDIFLVNVFLAVCHSLFEDTLLFVAIGANGLLILGVRLTLAILITYLFSRRRPEEPLPAVRPCVPQ